jgi:GNAT superfamily N-acetyltransferase
MTRTDDRTDLLDALERYYDEAPRVTTRTEEIGPFTLFVQAAAEGWPYYARPRLGLDGPFTADDVRRVRDRQRQLGVPEAIEWVHDTTPALTSVVRETDLELGEHPLMVLEAPVGLSAPDGVTTEVLGPDHPRLGEVLAAVSAGFGETDEVGAPRGTDDLRDRLAGGALRVVGAFGRDGVLGGGSHAPRGAVTELTGIAVLPRARGRGVGAAITAALVRDARDAGVGTVFLSAGTDRVAEIYARVGFVRIGTACVAEAASSA